MGQPSIPASDSKGRTAQQDREWPSRYLTTTMRVLLLSWKIHTDILTHCDLPTPICNKQSQALRKFIRHFQRQHIQCKHVSSHLSIIKNIASAWMSPQLSPTQMSGSPHQRLNFEFSRIRTLISHIHSSYDSKLKLQRPEFQVIIKYNVRVVFSLLF